MNIERQFSPLKTIFALNPLNLVTGRKHIILELYFLKEMKEHCKSILAYEAVL